MSQVWTPLEHRIWKTLCEHELQKIDRCILAVSGGLDSMVMLNIFARLCPNMKLIVAHFHHGENSADPIQYAHRQEARQLVESAVASLKSENITFVSEVSGVILKSEQEMRDARWAFLKGLCVADEPIVTAHHQDDHLETILLKLIRGTSAEGISGFRVWNGKVLRPLLNETKVELLRYADESHLECVVDPSNQDEAYLRNWLRNRWLPDLETRVPGSVANLAQSLFKIAAVADMQPDLEYVFDSRDRKQIDRSSWLTLSKTEQLRVLAIFLKKHQIYSFTSGQLEEIQKRLDKNQKDITFELLGRKWVINASQIMLQ